MALSSGLSLSRCCCNASAKAAFLGIRSVLNNQHSSRKVERKRQKKKYRENAIGFGVSGMVAIVAR